MNQKSIDSMVGLRTYMVSQSAAGLRQLHSRNHVKARPVKPLSTSNNICSSVVPLASQNWSAKMDHQEDCDLALSYLPFEPAYYENHWRYCQNPLDCSCIQSSSLHAS
ncbi:hypothetical protein AAHE18_09G089400 [Arachis hypogaea]